VFCLQDSRIFDSRNDSFDSDRLEMAEPREAAESALDAFPAIYGVKYEMAVECLIKDREGCWLSKISLPSTGNIYAPQTRSKTKFASVRHRFNDGSSWNTRY
jgi:hypothetical protein